MHTTLSGTMLQGDILRESFLFLSAKEWVVVGRLVSKLWENSLSEQYRSYLKTFSWPSLMKFQKTMLPAESAWLVKFQAGICRPRSFCVSSWRMCGSTLWWRDQEKIVLKNQTLLHYQATQDSMWIFDCLDFRLTRFTETGCPGGEWILPWPHKVIEIVEFSVARDFVYVTCTSRSGYIFELQQGTAILLGKRTISYPLSDWQGQAVFFGHWGHLVEVVSILSARQAIFLFSWVKKIKSCILVDGMAYVQDEKGATSIFELL